MGLRGLYEEALAQNEIALEKILKGYNTVLKENPVNVVCSSTHIVYRLGLRHTDNCRSPY